MKQSYTVTVNGTEATVTLEWDEHQRQSEDAALLAAVTGSVAALSLAFDALVKIRKVARALPTHLMEAKRNMENAQVELNQYLKSAGYHVTGGVWKGETGEQA